jgi:formylglycine-generating enzyme required for sulfatase activity
VHAARGQISPGTNPRFRFGNDEKELCHNGNGSKDSNQGVVWTIAPCNDGYADTSPAGHYAPNAFGLYDMFGNGLQDTADCWHDSYDGAPADGSAWTTGCQERGRVARGGSWYDPPKDLRAAARFNVFGSASLVGFRLARSLTP